MEIREVDTPYGQVQESDHHVHIHAKGYELARWASETVWPVSTLATLEYVDASFTDNGHLVDLEYAGGDDSPDDIPSDEFNAWSTDVLDEAGLSLHPATRR